METNSNTAPYVTEQHTGNAYPSFAATAGQSRGYSVPRKKSASSTKRTVHKSSKTAATKKIKFHSASCADAAQQESAFHKLDASVPQQAHKIQQRKKAIEKGKNTIGYEIYCNQVPKNKRRKKSMETPSTPDHTLDIPNKKWNGMVKAWRIALHKYDPKDLQESFAELQECEAAEKALEAKETSSDQPKTVKEQELEQAKSSGLLDFVNLGSNLKSNSDVTSPPPRLSQSDISMDMEDASPAKEIMSELDQWENAQGDEDDVDLLIDDVGDESDDDLL